MFIEGCCSSDGSLYAEANKIIMQSVVHNDKNYQSVPNNSNLEAEKDRKIRRLTQINKELIDTLKQQND